MSRWVVVECHDGGLIPCVVLRSEGGHAVLPWVEMLWLMRS